MKQIYQRKYDTINNYWEINKYRDIEVLINKLLLKYKLNIRLRWC